MNVIDVFLDRYTAYRLTLTGLGILAGISILEALLGWYPYSAIELLLSLVILLFATRTTNALCALFTKATPTPESAYITALILFFILSPLQSAADGVVFLIAGALAMLSKYAFAWGKVHIFNPAAFAVLAVSIAGTGLAVWWVATPLLFPFIFVIGLLVVRKVHRFDLFLTFAAVAILFFVVREGLVGAISLSSLTQFILTTPLFFAGTFMLVDPQTSPLTKTARSWYGIIVGVLSSVSFTIGPIITSPALALLIGNIFSFLTAKRKRIALSLQNVVQLSAETYEFEFVPSQMPVFVPGQHMEWTLPHTSVDMRGTRRYFAITSAPTEPVVRFATTIPIETSTFKETLLTFKNVQKKNTQNDTRMSATNVSGEFILPKDPNQKILAISGGISIAPFISMFRYLAIQGERRDIVLIYSAKTPLEFVYQKEIESFKDAIGLRVTYLPIDFPELSGWSGLSGKVTQEFIQKEVRDFKKRCWYLSGSAEQIAEYREISRVLGISKKAVKILTI